MLSLLIIIFLINFGSFQFSGIFLISALFFKIITEFGIFGFSIYLLLAFVLIDKKVSLENKIFLFPFLITQSIRGAGYFNGGFLLIMFILLILQFKNK